jgi:hypothetical protein
MPHSYLDIGMGGYFEGFGGCIVDQLLCPKRKKRVAA